MRLFHSLSDLPLFSGPLAITIGNFDGMHLGHQALLRYLNAYPQSAVITFSNHPSEILQKIPSPLLTTLSHRLTLLEDVGVKNILLLSFTQALSQLSAEDFLKMIRSSLPFSHLILGHDAVFGFKRSGTPAFLQSLAVKENFSLYYHPAVEQQGLPVSSSSIRQALQKGNLDLASSLLGRPYSIKGKVIKGEGRGKKLSFPTANISVEGLCLPPIGVYVVEALYNGQKYPAVANLGYAPTVRTSPSPRLEAHLIDSSIDLYDQEIEIIFTHYLRPEKRFSSIDQLQAQIHEDIQKAKEFHTNSSKNLALSN